MIMYFAIDMETGVKIISEEQVKDHVDCEDFRVIKVEDYKVYASYKSDRSGSFIWKDINTEEFN